MATEAQLVTLLALTAGAVLVWRARFRGSSSRIVSTTSERGQKAAELMKDWAVWLAAIQTALISALLVLFGGTLNFPPLAIAACAYLGASVLLETVLLAGLPSVVLRLCPDGSTDNDIYEQPLFVFWKLRTGAVYLLAHWCFLIGVASAAIQFVAHGVPPWPK